MRAPSVSCVPSTEARLAGLKSARPAVIKKFRRRLLRESSHSALDAMPFSNVAIWMRMI
jgi:hypothetical protein